MTKQQGLAWLFTLTVATNLVLLAVAVYVHPQTFSLVMDPFSWLGKLVTDQGLSNTRGMVLFSAALILNAALWHRACLMLRTTRFWHYPVPLFCALVRGGFFVMSLPCDQFVLLHSFGAGLVVGGLWAFTASALFYARHVLGAGTHAILQVLLHATALYCGINFFLDTPYKGFSQRPLLVAILADLALCLKAWVRAGSEARLESQATVDC